MSSLRINPQLSNRDNLFSALAYHRNDLVAELVRRGLNLNELYLEYDIDNAGNEYERFFTYLEDSINRGDFESVKILVENGADVNALNMDAKYDTPIFSAILQANKQSGVPGNLNILKYLIERGANIEYRDFNGLTPMDLANELGNREIIDVLSQGIQTARQISYEQSFKLILNDECGICLEPFAKDETVCSPDSCQHGFHCDCIQKWVDKGKRTCPICRKQFNKVTQTGFIQQNSFGKKRKQGITNINSDIKYLRSL